MARQLVGKKYNDMSQGYRDRVSQDEFRGRRKAQRMAGNRMDTRKDIVQGYGQLSPERHEEYGSRQQFRDARKEFNKFPLKTCISPALHVGPLNMVPPPPSRHGG